MIFPLKTYLQYLIEEKLNLQIQNYHLLTLSPVHFLVETTAPDRQEVEMRMTDQEQFQLIREGEVLLSASCSTIEQQMTKNGQYDR
ncbi:hypothetical protein [Persicobacter psychrovividus]|uniref:Uncharacterized protein n=1 Tax=Persicobacter psychrovividus TaxID=387638 RepID=A0ABM7VHW6_9BACT|nr:hypothetical protein PEPS_28460 [Persicobacter psychrovividus]